MDTLNDIYMHRSFASHRSCNCDGRRNFDTLCIKYLNKMAVLLLLYNETSLSGHLA